MKKERRRLLNALPFVILAMSLWKTLLFFPFEQPEIFEEFGVPTFRRSYDTEYLTIPKSTNPRTIWSNQPLFTCGFRYGRLHKLLFPEFQEEKRLIRQASFNEHSLLVHGLSGPCPHDFRDIEMPWIYENFSGTVLVVNSNGLMEADRLNITGGRLSADVRSNNTYEIGLLPDSNRSIHVLQMAINLIGRYEEEQWYNLWIPSRRPRSNRRYFLSYIASNCVDFREDAVDRLAEIGTVHAGGSCNGNLNNTWLVQDMPEKAKVIRAENNFKSMRNYRFCLVMENTNLWGYITEKIVNAFLAGCIPIYYGTEQVFDVFNPRAFVYYNISDPEPAQEQVEYLEQHKAAYRAMQREPILTDGGTTVEKYFSLAPHVGNGLLWRKIRSLMGMSIVHASGSTDNR